MSKLLFALSTFPVTTVHNRQKVGELYYRIDPQLRKLSLSKMMHIHALKFYLESTVVLIHEVYQNEAETGNPGKQISFGYRWVPQQEEAAPGRKRG